MTALEVVVGENGTANDRKVSIGADKIVREYLYKVKELGEGGTVDLHWCVGTVKDDAVLVVVNIWGILEEPVLIIDGNRDSAQVLAGRVVHSAAVTGVLLAEHTLGVTCLLGVFCGGNGLRVLFRLAEVNGDVHWAVNAVGLPLHILYDSVAADVVAVAGELIEVVCGLFRGFLVEGLEISDDLRRSWGQKTHDLCVEKIFLGDTVTDNTLLHSVVKNARKDLFQRHGR